jgi:hypothetical protein
VIRLGAESFEVLVDEIAFLVENLNAPACTLEHAGRFYEEVAEGLRAHAILRLLLDANPQGFSHDLVMSGHARRAFLRRCKSSAHADCYLAFSRSGSMLDAIAGDDLALAAEIFKQSPTKWQPDDEYEDDFCYQRYLGLELTDAPPVERKAMLDQFEIAADGDGARLEACRAFYARDSKAFETAFEALLQVRGEEVDEDAGLADEELIVAIGSKVFIEGVAVLKLARRAGLAIADQYPMCPLLALLPQQPAAVADEFAAP